MKRCDICSGFYDCHYCMWYEGPRSYADNTVIFKDYFVMSPSKATARRANGEFAEGFLEGLKEGMEDKKAFHCGFEESGYHAYNCNDCPNKCDEWYQWDKEMKGDEDEHIHK